MLFLIIQRYTNYFIHLATVIKEKNRQFVQI